MAFSENCRQSPIPSFLYFSSSSSSSTSSKTLFLEKITNCTSNPSSLFSPPPSANGTRTTRLLSFSNISFLIPAPSEPTKIELYSPHYYAACTVGGILSCGLTHTAITPLDLVKCNMQIDPSKYKSIPSGFRVLLKEQGVKGLFRGWAPTLVGYSAQGACKFGFYEYFKKYYSDIAGPEYALKYKTVIYLAASASAEFIADIALCPFEAVKVRVQTQPGFARGLSGGFPKLVKSEGIPGYACEVFALLLYKGLVPLRGRQIPYTMMKFASFETIVEMLYNAKGATVRDAVKQLGLWGLFTRGLPLRIVMTGTLTGAQWGIYDAFKVFVGLPTTGGVAPAAAKAATELAKI
ncbi:hypothetical protein Vadar_018615 [Vaccinium darrowii]|uniref:Uncharacterized protein n=1 Tax=Vaccinium darrowii TaxID=229202 RepID=A0ACB7Y1N8_9ERIC|nr:hypothetical protein Vadar_018615 [Vaccinium darrowii]